MQLRYDTQLTVNEYISTKAWEKATLSSCPNHPKGGCSLARHGTYTRKCGRGRIARIARWYCADSHTTFSLLPDCLAARMPGSLRQLEQIAAAIEQDQEPLEVMRHIRDNAKYVESAAQLRWLARQLSALQRVLVTVCGLLPDVFAGCPPAVLPMRAALDAPWLLSALREHCAEHLQYLPPPLGFFQIRSSTDPPQSANTC